MIMGQGLWMIWYYNIKAQFVKLYRQRLNELASFLVS